MVFSSLTYLLLFMPIMIGLTFVCKKTSWKNAVLLLASVLFYGWGEPLWVYALIGLSFLVWLCAVGIHRAEAKWLKRLCLALAVTMPIAVPPFYC